jgi:hypothetical protein
LPNRAQHVLCFPWDERDICFALLTGANDHELHMFAWRSGANHRANGFW